MIGFSVRPIRRRIGADVIAKATGLPVANASDCMSRILAGGPRLRPMHGKGYLAGPAFTVKTRPGDNLMVHKALDMAEPDDVIVVDAGGDLTNAIIGEIMSAYAEFKKLAGVVIYGAIRDSGPIRAGAYPVYAAGVTHRGPYRTGPGEIGSAIAIEGMVIEPGDLIIGDEDGILCLPYDDAESVLDAAWKKNAAEEKTLAKVRGGEQIDRAWIDAALKESGAVIED